MKGQHEMLWVLLRIVGAALVVLLIFLVTSKIAGFNLWGAAGGLI